MKNFDFTLSNFFPFTCELSSWDEVTRLIEGEDFYYTRFLRDSVEDDIEENINTVIEKILTNETQKSEIISSYFQRYHVHPDSDYFYDKDVNTHIRDSIMYIMNEREYFDTHEYLENVFDFRILSENIYEESCKKNISEYDDAQKQYIIDCLNDSIDLRNLYKIKTLDIVEDKCESLFCAIEQERQELLTEIEENRRWEEIEYEKQRQEMMTEIENYLKQEESVE